MDKKNLRTLLTPIVLALAIVAGMLIDRALPGKGTPAPGARMYMPVSGSKVDVILNMIQHSYYPW